MATSIMLYHPKLDHHLYIIVDGSVVGTASILYIINGEDNTFSSSVAKL